VLEEATRVLKDDRDKKWKAELRYLKLWMLYASYVEKPSIVYVFLLANEVGTGWALLYEEYAGVLERSGR
jgi:spindle assembly checkpoint component MAD3